MGSYATQTENDAVMAIVQIESAEGLENVDAIVATEGVDGVFPGPVDFSLSAYGEPLMNIRDSRLREPLERIIDVAHAAGKPVGLPIFSPDDVPLVVEMGADWLQYGNDIGWVTAAARQTVVSAEEAIRSVRSAATAS